MISHKKTPRHEAGASVSVQQSLELKPQRKLAYAIPAGVAEARGENPSEGAGCERACTLTQILAWIVEVGVVGEIGKAALELQLESLREVEILS